MTRPTRNAAPAPEPKPYVRGRIEISKPIPLPRQVVERADAVRRSAARVPVVIPHGRLVRDPIDAAVLLVSRQDREARQDARFALLIEQRLRRSHRERLVEYLRDLVR